MAMMAGWTMCYRLSAQDVDPRGPVNYSGMTVTVDDQGVQARNYQFQNDVVKPAPWSAHWIWSASETTATPGPAAAMFRKEITLATAPQSVSAWLTADMKYRLYINGRLASRGPVDIGRDYQGGSTHRWFYDARDLAAYFTAGTNVIAAEVFSQTPNSFTVSRGHAGFLFEAAITGADGRVTTVTSDPTWHALPAWQFPRSTTYDAAKEPAGWRQSGFDDSCWPNSLEVPDVWETLIPSEIPPLMETRYPVARIEGLPASRVFTNDGSFKVVFDRVLSAYPTLVVRGGAGAELSFKAHSENRVKLDGRELRFEFPFLTEIAPSLTFDLKNVTSPVEIVDVGANFTSQPLAYRGEFACNDEKLNRLWDVSRWAVQICLQTHHLDSPGHQEPISDAGDYVIESMVNHYAFAQPWLARQDLRKFAWLLQDEHYHNFHTSYSIAWLQMLMDYYDYTGDESLVRELTPYVHGLLDTYASWRGTNGILSEAPNYMFMDWVNIAGIPCHHPPAVIGQGYLTALYYHGLELGVRVAALNGDTQRVEQYNAWRRELSAAFNRELWVADKGLYRDGRPFQTHVKPSRWLPADKDIETFSPHVNLLAVLYNLAPAAQQPAIVQKTLLEKPLKVQPWFMHWVFPAIDHAGLFDACGTALLRRWQIVPETQSFREMWASGDFSHGWGATPLVQMSARILGVTPASPGFKSILIRPTLCDLQWAQGRVPTPHGEVVVAWKLGTNQLDLEVTVPAETTAEVVLPLARFEQPVITLDGRAAGSVEQVAPGRHHFVVAGKLNPLPTATRDDAAPGLEAEVVKDDLLHGMLAQAEDHCSHTGGAANPGALFNGTLRNGSGGRETLDDGKTFRGYGGGDWLVFHFKQPCDLTEIRSFAAHPDDRAGQNYTVLVAYAAAPAKFVPLGSVTRKSTGGETEARLPVKAEGVVAVRFEFQSGPAGFNVYREFNVLGSAATGK